jgi:hypothetical protein
MNKRVRKFFGYFPRKERRIEPRERYSEYIRVNDHLSIRVVADSLMPDKIDVIKDIVISALEQERDDYGYFIARELVKAQLYPKLCSARVNGGECGEDWLIELSSNPHAFID